MDLTPFIELGGTVVVAVFAIWALVQYANKKNPMNGSSKAMLKELQELNNNHLHDICDRVDKQSADLVAAIKEMHMDLNNGQKQMIGLLGEIKGRLIK